MTSRPIVVGVDGSPEGRTAVEVAAKEAARRRVALRVVHGFIWPYMKVPLGPAEHGPAEGGLRHQADRIVADAVKAARLAAPGIRVSGEVIVGSAAQALIAASRDATMVVVGDRGLGAFAGLLVGSVAIHLTAHASSPVLVVRGRSDRSAPVVLAADGSPGNDGAVGFAFEEAALRDCELLVLHAWHNPARGIPGEMLSPVYDEALVQDEEKRVLAEALAGWPEKYPDVVVRRRIVHAGVRRTLIDASREAQLIVMGSRGRGGFAGLLLGSASQAVLHHAECPVAIVPTAS
jgi:nucleotide-binding universal stress UspA family protein